MTHDPPDDDLCQIVNCQLAHFTYCPHCELFVCIQHLNEHHSNYKQDYQILIDKSKSEQTLNQQSICWINEEKQRLMAFFKNEIDRCRDYEKYLIDRTKPTTIATIRPQDCANLRTRIQRTAEEKTRFKNLISQIQQLITDYEEQKQMKIENTPAFVQIKTEATTSKKESSISSLAQFSIDYNEIDDEANSAPTTTHDEQNIPDVSNGEYSNSNENSEHDSQMTNDNDDPSRSDDDIDADDNDDDNRNGDPDFGACRSRSVSPSRGRRRKHSQMYSKGLLNHFQVNTCPLTNFRYGIDFKKHPIRHIPCDRHNVASIYLFTHLRVFHCLSSKASLCLVRHIIANGCDREIDLFSRTSESLVNVLPKSFRGRCPLTKLGAFGLNKFHDIRLCDESLTHPDTGLLNHFVLYHCLSYPWANKLCNAMQAGDYDGSKRILFEPNEPIKAKKWLTTQGKLILARRRHITRRRRGEKTKT